MPDYLVWASYYSETATVGIVSADTADEAAVKFWAAEGERDHWPSSGVYAEPAKPGFTVNIDVPH